MHSMKLFGSLQLQQFTWGAAKLFLKGVLWVSCKTLKFKQLWILHNFVRKTIVVVHSTVLHSFNSLADITALGLWHFSIILPHNMQKNTHIHKHASTPVFFKLCIVQWWFCIHQLWSNRCVCGSYWMNVQYVAHNTSLMKRGAMKDSTIPLALNMFQSVCSTLRHTSPTLRGISILSTPNMLPVDSFSTLFHVLLFGKVNVDTKQVNI